MNYDPKETYLWDRSGPPDEEIQQLEKLLAPLRYQPPAKPRFSKLWLPALAAAAALLIAALVISQRPVASEWAANGRVVQLGESITARSEIALNAGSVGAVMLEPGSTLRITGNRSFTLDHGTLHALIWAPPGQFTVGTRAATAIDLGCQYTLQSDQNGAGLLTVQTGWVAFQSGDVESFIPAGAACRTYPRGPGTPFVQSSPDALRTALDRFDSGDRAALPTILTLATRDDALTLWHLLTRTKAAERASVYDRLATFVSLPPRDAILRNDPASLDAAWNSLGYGDTDWWRTWKHSWR